MMHELNHTPHTKKRNIEFVVAFHVTNIMSGTNYKSIKPQIDTTPCEHVTQGLHIVLNEALPTHIYHSTPIGGNYFPIRTS
jgi:hypothetical protein